MEGSDLEARRWRAGWDAGAIGCGQAAADTHAAPRSAPVLLAVARNAAASSLRGLLVEDGVDQIVLGDLAEE